MQDFSTDEFFKGSREECPAALFFTQKQLTMDNKFTSIPLVLCVVLLWLLVIKTEHEQSTHYTAPPIELDTQNKTFSGTLYVSAAYYGAVPAPEPYTRLDTLYNAHQCTPFQTVVYVVQERDTLGYFPITTK